MGTAIGKASHRDHPFFSMPANVKTFLKLFRAGKSASMFKSSVRNLLVFLSFCYK